MRIYSVYLENHKGLHPKTTLTNPIGVEAESIAQAFNKARGYLKRRYNYDSKTRMVCEGKSAALWIYFTGSAEITDA